MTETSEFVLYDLEPHSDDEPYLVHSCRVIPGGGSAARGEVLVSVSPPVNSGGVLHDQLRLSARGGALRVSDDLMRVDPEATDRCTVNVSSLVASDSFLPVSAVIGLEVPEWVQRGGYWRWFQDALSAFLAREGHLDVPDRHVENGFELGRYVEKVKREHHYGTLGTEKEKWLEGLPRWNWEVEDLPPPAVIDPSTIREHQMRRNRDSKNG